MGYINDDRCLLPVFIPFKINKCKVCKQKSQVSLQGLVSTC